MNSKLQEYARRDIKNGLEKLPEKWQKMFKRLYSHGDLDKPINDVVDGIPEEKLDTALYQVQNSLSKINRQEK